MSFSPYSYISKTTQAICRLYLLNYEDLHHLYIEYYRILKPKNRFLNQEFIMLRHFLILSIGGSNTELVQAFLGIFTRSHTVDWNQFLQFVIVLCCSTEERLICLLMRLISGDEQKIDEPSFCRLLHILIPSFDGTTKFIFDRFQEGGYFTSNSMSQLARENSVVMESLRDLVDCATHHILNKRFWDLIRSREHMYSYIIEYYQENGRLPPEALCHRVRRFFTREHDPFRFDFTRCEHDVQALFDLCSDLDGNRSSSTLQTIPEESFEEERGTS